MKFFSKLCKRTFGSRHQNPFKTCKKAEEFRMSYVQFGWENYSFDICSSMFQHRPETNEDHKQQKWPVTYWYFGGERTQIETFWFPERDVYVG